MNTGDTAWVLASAALVMLMTPALALFYGGMVRRKSVLNMLMMSFICLVVVTILWGVGGFGLAFGPDIGGNAGPGLLGQPDWFLHRALTQLTGNGSDTVPMLAFAMFQLMFAVLTVALISGSVAERVKFGGWTIFVALWSIVVYFPIAHWVFDSQGWLHGAPIHALDFAGGTAVHMNAGAAGLALALVVKQRAGWPKDPALSSARPHNTPFVLLGACLLWFGWYGFNAGSALIAGKLASVAFTNTTLATAASVAGWLLVEQVTVQNRRLRFGGRAYPELRPSALGAASGAVAGLVAITPACAFVAPVGALAIGLVAGVGCGSFVSSNWKRNFSRRLGGPVDDTLDVVGIHLVGGLIGTLLIGLLATTGVNGQGADGLFYGGGLDQLWRQAVAGIAVAAYSFGMTFVIGKLADRILRGGLRVPDAVQLDERGVDWDEHQEIAYDFADPNWPAPNRSRD
jgi:Amt family ammonium transporter